MNIKNYIATQFEDVFDGFNFQVNLSEVRYPKCIAYENLGGSDYRVVYEVYLEGKPRFFGVSRLEFPQTPEDGLEWVKQWTKTSKIKLLDASKDEPRFLFELSEPFGIHFSGSHR